MKLLPLALNEPIEVELVGGEADLLGPLLIAGAAILAAAVAAYWQWRQLRHDREVRDREFIRNSISQAVASLATAIDDMSGFSGATHSVDQAEEETRELRTKRHSDTELSGSLKAEARATEKARDARQAVRSSLMRMITDNLHLRVALGANDPVVVSHGDLCEAFEEWFKDLTPDRAIQAKRESGELKPGQMFQPARKRFETACYEWIASKR